MCVCVCMCVCGEGGRGICVCMCVEVSSREVTCTAELNVIRRCDYTPYLLHGMGLEWLCTR